MIANAYKTVTNAWVLALLEEREMDATALARKIGVSPTTLTRPLYSEKYKPAIGGRTMQKIAEHLRVQLPDVSAGKSTPVPTSLVIVSHVGAGDAIYPENAPFDEVDLPPGASEGVFGLIIRGNSQFPRFLDGEIIICRAVDDPMSLLKKEAVVDLVDGRRLLKRIESKTAGNKFTLESWNADPIKGVQIERAAEILWHQTGRR